ncbi:MAG: hypothetical protein HYZ83_05285 [Candidatus Omnitrophica bacterium]|nr:hypothetical protein [Candidatus Omnitrophota bacterium]
MKSLKNPEGGYLYKKSIQIKINLKRGVMMSKVKGFSLFCLILIIGLFQMHWMPVVFANNEPDMAPVEETADNQPGVTPENASVNPSEGEGDFPSGGIEPDGLNLEPSDGEEDQNTEEEAEEDVPDSMADALNQEIANLERQIEGTEDSLAEIQSYLESSNGKIVLVENKVAAAEGRVSDAKEKRNKAITKGERAEMELEAAKTELNIANHIGGGRLEDAKQKLAKANTASFNARREIQLDENALINARKEAGKAREEYYKFFQERLDARIKALTQSKR